MGSVVSGTAITLISADKVREATTNAYAEFEFSALPSGAYDLEVFHPGFSRQRMTNVRIIDAQVRLVTFILPFSNSGECGDMGPSISCENRTGKVNLAGTVTDAHNNPLKRAAIKVIPLKSGHEISLQFQVR